MIIKIEAFIQEEKMDDVIDALAEMNVHGITCYQVMGCGVQHGLKRYARGHQEIPVHMLPKIKLEVLVSTEEWEKKVIETIRQAAYTGNHGDGKVFSYDVRTALRIRTGETGSAAIQPD